MLYGKLAGDGKLGSGGVSISDMQTGSDRKRTTRISFEAAELPQPLSTVYSYWRSLSPDGHIPRRESFDPVAIGCSLDHLILVGIQADPLEFHFRVIGDYVNCRLREPCMHKPLSQVPGKGPGSEVWALYERCYTERLALFDQLNYIGPVRGIHHSCEIYLPLADEAGEVVSIVVCLTFDRDGNVRCFT